MGLAGLTATGVCSMVGAGINVIPFMIQRNVPGIGPFVLEAFAFAPLPELLCCLTITLAVEITQIFFEPVSVI